MQGGSRINENLKLNQYVEQLMQEGTGINEKLQLNQYVEQLRQGENATENAQINPITQKILSLRYLGCPAR